MTQQDKDRILAKVKLGFFLTAREYALYMLYLAPANEIKKS